MSKKPAKKKQFNLNIFTVLNKIGLKDRNYYDSLTETEQKGFAPLITQRWLSGTNDAKQIIHLNELLNPYVFNLDKKLLYFLMMTCVTNSNRYNWIKSILSSPSADRMTQVIKEYFGYSRKDAVDALPILSNNQILDMANELGYQDVDIKALKTELKKR